MKVITSDHNPDKIDISLVTISLFIKVATSTMLNAIFCGFQFLRSSDYREITRKWDYRKNYQLYGIQTTQSKRPKTQENRRKKNVGKTCARLTILSKNQTWNIKNLLALDSWKTLRIFRKPKGTGRKHHKTNETPQNGGIACHPIAWKCRDT